MPHKIQIKDKSDTGELFKISAFKKEIRKTTPHKHNNYIEIVYLSKGSGTHSIDRNSYKIDPPVIFFIRKEQVHHWDIKIIPNGYVAIIKKEFIEKSVDGELKKLLSELSRFSSLKLLSTSAIDSIFELLTKEDDFTVAEGLFKALFAKIMTTAQPHIESAAKPNELLRFFIALLNNSHSLQNSVGYYAKRLHTTPQNLNHICQKCRQQSASELIATYIVSEAKRLLFYTDKTVSEIGYALGFKDNSHFTKYFKKRVGKTPSRYRKEN